jgi:predicted porin
MKKSLIALAALAAVGAVSAQSSVSISGRMDASLRYTAKVAPGAANYTLTEDGGANAIRFAITEDLGGGLRAVADVGMRFGIADGLSQASGARPLFQGETRVGVVGGFGTIKLGRSLGCDHRGWYGVCTWFCHRLRSWQRRPY